MTLGQLLKSKRSELGRSLEQISAATKIHVKILQALENDQYSELPARTFTRGFIVTYCKALKLDSDQVLKNIMTFSNLNSPNDKTAIKATKAMCLKEKNSNKTNAG